MMTTKDLPVRSQTVPEPQKQITRGNYRDPLHFDFDLETAKRLNNVMRADRIARDKSDSCWACTVFLLYGCVSLAVAVIVGWQVSIAVEKSGETFVVAVVLAIFTSTAVFFVSFGFMFLCTCCCCSIVNMN